MNSMQDIPSLNNPRELSGVLVCDALVLRDGIVGSNPKRTDFFQASGHRMAQVGK